MRPPTNHSLEGGGRGGGGGVRARKRWGGGGLYLTCMNFATLKRILTCRGDCGEGGEEQLVAERRGIGLGDVWP
jgi:hypothetical protein